MHNDKDDSDAAAAAADDDGDDICLGSWFVWQSFLILLPAAKVLVVWSYSNLQT